MNKVVLIGRFTKDPVLSFIPTTGTATCKSVIAVDRYNPSTKQKEADFVQCVFWGKQAEAVANNMIKGSLIGICGSIRTRSYDDKDGTKKYATEVNVSETKFLGGKKDSQGSHEFNPSNNPFGGSSYDDMTPVDSDDVPF